MAVDVQIYQELMLFKDEVRELYVENQRLKEDLRNCITANLFLPIHPSVQESAPSPEKDQH